MKKLLISSFIITSLLLSGSIVEAKASSIGPTAKCRDGTYSYAKTHRGACSWHKGVKTWYK